MSLLECSTAKRPDGILEIEFVGVCPRGSQGNDHSAEMAQCIEREVAQHKPVALLLDLNRLDYEFGDSIFSIPRVVGFKDSELSIPCAIVASGKTFTALTWRFKSNPEESFLGVPLCASKQDALAFLSQRVKGQEDRVRS
jgi:hypothetical protein